MAGANRWTRNPNGDDRHRLWFRSPAADVLRPKDGRRPTMIPTVNVAACIESLLTDYRAQPLSLMREIGIQARLHRLLQRDLADETCRMQVRTGDSRRRQPVATCYLAERVQMEVRVTNADGHGPEKSDIVVLRSTRDEQAMPITATRYANGAFDIISKIDIADAAAVIEVKAACSADFQQRHLFRCDLNKLLELRKACEAQSASPELHFVLIDKSVAISGRPTEGFGVDPLVRAMPRHDWHVESEQFLGTQTERGVREFWTNSPRALLLDATPDSRAFVHVWEMAHQAGTAILGVPLHRYAVSMPGS